MRFLTLILSFGIALTCIAPSSFAATNALARAGIGTSTCPLYEGYPDCSNATSRTRTQRTLRIPY